MKSAIALSMHKAGSSIADLIFTEIFKARGYGIDRISRSVPGSPLTEREVFQQYQPKMKTDGVYYGIARDPGTHNMDILPKLRLLIQMRDPRDCITSAYFSLRESHVPPSDPEKLKQFEAKRQSTQAQKIDKFARNSARNYVSRLDKLSQAADDHPDCLVLHYEEMVEDTERWLDRVLAFIGQPMTPELEKALAPHLRFSVSTEDTTKHKRQVSPGDHRRKLSPETIAHIDQLLGPGMRSFGYTV